jgi:hypothetical protein
MPFEPLDWEDDELLDIIAPLIDEDEDEEWEEHSTESDGFVQGCQDCQWNPDACDCGRYDGDD